MVPMTYDRACKCYHDVVLDIAKQQSVNIFTVIAEGVKDATIFNDVNDIMTEWYNLRKTILAELQETHYNG